MSVHPFICLSVTAYLAQKVSWLFCILIFAFFCGRGANYFGRGVSYPQENNKDTFNTNKTNLDAVILWLYAFVFFKLACIHALLGICHHLNQGSEATRHLQISLDLKPVWMRWKFFEKRNQDCQIRVKFRLAADF